LLLVTIFRPSKTVGLSVVSYASCMLVYCVVLCLGWSVTHDSGAVYINTRQVHTLPARDLRRPTCMTRHQEKPSSKDIDPFHDDDDDDGYCLPQPHLSLLKDSERGQGVGAEEDRDLYHGPALTRFSHQSMPANPSGTVTSPTSPLCPLEWVGFTCLDDVPADLGRLTVVEVLQCLRWLKLDKYVETFRSQQIDGELLMSVDPQLLVEEFGFKRFEAIKLEKFARSGWRPKMDRASMNEHQYYYQPQLPQQPQHIELRSSSPNESLYTDV